MRGALSNRTELFLSALSGAALVLAFPPFNLVPAAFVALVPLFFAVSRVERQGFWRGFRPGFIAGVTFFLLLLHWLVFLASDQMNNPVVMSGPLILLVLLQSFYWGLFSASAVFVGARTRVPWFVILPVFWVAFEQLRSLGVIGFTWGAVGYAAVTVPRAIQFASVTGLFGVSGWIVLVNALVLGLFMGRGRGAWARSLGLAAVLAAPLLHGTLAVRSAGEWPTVRVAVIQPNIAGETKWDAAYKSVSFDRLEALSLEAAEEHPDLIVWPETAAPSYLLLDRADFERVAATAAAAGAPVLTGCPNLVTGNAAAGAGRALNSALLIGADGVLRGQYSKMKLVPFGEVIPFETVVPLLENVDFGEADFWPGDEPVVFETGKGAFSVLICYESTFPRLVRRFVVGGAEFLVNITNDVWYGRTPMPFQHAAMAVMRSVENRRSLARSANSGVSMLVDPYGRVLDRTPVFEEGVLVGDLPLVGSLTFYARYGDVFPWAVTGCGGLLLVLSLAGAAAPRSRRAGQARGGRRSQ